MSWRIAAPVLVAGLLALLGLYAGTAVSMFDLWSSTSAFDHAFLVIPVCLYLTWERRHVLAGLVPSPNLYGILLLAGFGAVWLVADTVDVSVGRQFALIGMAEGLILALLGWRIFRALLFPLMYLWLVLPTDFNLLLSLQTLATIMSSWGIGLLGIPTFVEGVYIEIPSGRYWVAPGCAGLNFLLSGFALSLLYVERIYDDWRKRVAGVLIMLAVALVANWIRIFGLIVAGHYLNDIYDINDHYTEGWLFFAAIVFITMWIGLRFRDPVREIPRAAAAPPPSAHRHQWRAFAVMAALSAFAVGFYPAYATYRLTEAPLAFEGRVAFPASVGAWRAVPDSGGWRPKFNRAHAQDTQRYSDGRRNLDLYIAYYADQRQGRELVAHDNRVDDGKTWIRIGGGGAAARIGGRGVDMTLTRLRSASGLRVVWHLYWVDGRYTPSAIIAKLLQAKADLLFGDQRAGFLAVSAEDGVEPAAIRDFLAALPPFAALIAPSPAGS